MLNNLPWRAVYPRGMMRQVGRTAARKSLRSLAVCGALLGPTAYADPVFSPAGGLSPVEALPAVAPLPPVATPAGVSPPEYPTAGTLIAPSPPASTVTPTAAYQPPPEAIAPAPAEPVVLGMPLPQPTFEPTPAPWYESNRCTDCLPWLDIYQGSSYGAVCPCPVHDRPGFSIDGLARAYYANDQRINWTGMEATFGAEGILAPRFIAEVNGWNISANGVFFLNQHFDGNKLDEPGLAPYHKNFEVDPFQIWNMNVRFTKDDLTISVGKDNTPFGRYYFPLFTNSRMDSPFLRSDVIQWVETGIFARYSPGIFVGDIAITNGLAERDTNSMKALVARLGINTPSFVAGISGKLHDGSGSEKQKQYGSYYGADAMMRWGAFDLSGEFTYDQYGMWHDFDPNNITWGRSLYYRDLYSGQQRVPLSALGYYLNLGWTHPRLRVDLNYGEYYPHAIGNVLNDTPVRRGLAKATWRVMPHVESYTALLWENVRPLEPFRKWQLGTALLSGVQVYF